MGRSNAEATIYTERDGDAFAPGTSLARDHPDAAITPRPPSRRRRSRLRSATASRRSQLRRLGTESLHDSSLEETVSSEPVSGIPIPWLLGKIQGNSLELRCSPLGTRDRSRAYTLNSLVTKQGIFQGMQ